MHRDSMRELCHEEVEDAERLTMRWLFQAALDFGMQAHEVFLNSPDKPQDIAEDIVREMLDSVSLHGKKLFEIGIIGIAPAA